MSFNNDEDGDGLAALFGGITPQAPPKAADGARPAVAPTPPAQQPPTQRPPTQQPVAQQPPAQQPAAQQPPAQPPAVAYPTAAYPAAPASAPGYPAPTSYDLPAPTEPPPASAYPSETPHYPGLSPDPSAAPHYPGLAAQPPVAPAQYSPATQYPPTQYPPTQYPPTAYPGLAQQGTPSAPPSYDLPAPVSQPPVQYPAQPTPSAVPEPLTEPPGFPSLAPSVPEYSTTPPAEFAQPVSYDLPPPAAAPSLPPTPGFEPTPVYQPTPSYDSTATYDPAPSYDRTAAYDPTAGYQSAATAEPQQQPSAHEPAVGAALAATPVTPVGPLLPSRTAAVVTPEDLERATVGEKVGLALAILTGPIGLLIAIISAARGGRRRGWLIGISRISLVLGVLSTVATVIVGIVLWNIRVDQIQHDGLAAASSEFCEAADADPSMVTAPTLGFPAQGNSIPETIDAMTAWTTRWTDLAATSPAELRTGLELLAEKGQTIVDSVTESRSVDDALNAQVIGSIEAQSGVPAWYENYCVAP